MSQATNVTTMPSAPGNRPAAPFPTRLGHPPEYRRLCYRMFRTEGVRNGRLYRLSAVAAWRLARQFPFPSLAQRYAEALS